MSVGIIQIPSLYEPAYNPNYFLVSGTNSASGNYKLMCRIQAPSGNIVATLKLPTDPIQTQSACFDVGRILESYVTHTIDIGLNRVATAPDCIQDYLVEFGEEYGTPTPTEYWTGLNVQPCFVISAALSTREFNAYNYLDYLQGAGTRKFLNKYKGTRTVFSTTKAFLYFLQDETYPVTSILIDPYTSAGVALGSSVIDQPYTGSAYSTRLLYFPAGPTNLNLIPQASLLSGTSGSLIPASTSYYDVYLRWSGGGAVGEKLRFSIIDNCSKYTNYPIYFLGQYPSMEVWNFNRRSDVVHQITKKDYKQPLGRFLDSTHYGYEDTDRQLTTYNSEVTDSVTLNTDNLTEAELGFLKECVQSPIVYSLEDGVLIPVKITDSQFTAKKKVNDKIFNLTITIEYASTLELQRG